MGRVRHPGSAGRMRLVNAGDGAGPLTLADYCRPFDGLHVAGGGNLTDAFPDELFQRSCLMAAFADQGKPVVLTGQQIGPFRSPRPAAALAAVLDRTVFVGVRDPVDSLSFCRAALATPRHALMGDDALGGPGGAEAIDQSLLARLGIPRGPFLVANLRVGPYTDGGRRHVEAVAALLDEISRAAFLPVVFVPTALGASDSDIETGRAVAQATRIAAVTVLEPPGLTPAVVRAVIGAAHGAVAMSHHVCTFALAQGVPAVCLFDGPYYGQKARALAAFWQDDRFALPLAALDPAGAASLVVAVFRDADLRWRLAERGRDAVHQWEDVFDREVRRAFGSGRPLPVPGSA
jgi:polysaccharide pyruvyl transferase WcaK-like protein